MKRIGIKRCLLAVAFLGSLGSAWALESNEEITILQGLKEDANFTTLVSLLESSGLSEDLSGTSDFTLLAPTNEAFEALGAAQLMSLEGDVDSLTGILQLHVLQGEYPVLDLNRAEEGSLSNLFGEPVIIEQSAGGLMVNDAGLVSTDVDNFYLNGVVHVVSEVLVPAATAMDDTPTNAVTDVNGDGVVDDADLMSDTNGDGVIDVNDVADSNNDGVVNEDDYVAAGVTDTNGDGVVDAQDITMGDVEATDSTSTDSTMTLTDINGDGALNMADVTDTNNDGVVDALDYTAFGFSDTNNDGVVDNNDVMTDEMEMGQVMSGLVSDSDNDDQMNCEDNDDMIDSDGDGADTDQCIVARQ